MCHKYNCVYLFLPWHIPQKADRTGQIQPNGHPGAHWVSKACLKAHSEFGEPVLSTDYTSALIGFIKYVNIRKYERRKIEVSEKVQFSNHGATENITSSH